MHHLMVTRPFGPHKAGTLITDPAEVVKHADNRSVVKVFAHLTHVGIEAEKAVAAAYAAAKAASVESEPAPASAV